MPPLTNLDKLPVDPAQGYGFREQPRPEYLQALDQTLLRLNDPRNMWIGVGMPWLYHGTRLNQAKNILEKGFDPKRIGENWSIAFEGLGGRSGRGVYLAENPKHAADWANTSAGEKPGILRVFVPKKKILDVSSDPEVRRMQPFGRSLITDTAAQQGYQAVKFPNETVVMDPTTIPLRNIRPLDKPTYDTLSTTFGFGD